MCYYIIFSSITHASRVKNYFNNERGFVSIMHTPSCISPGGCTYSLKLNEDKMQRAIGIAKQYGYRILGVYVEHDDKTFTQATEVTI